MDIATYPHILMILYTTSFVNQDKKVTNFHEIWYAYYTVRGHLNLVLWNFLHSAMRNWGSPAGIMVRL